MARLVSPTAMGLFSGLNLVLGYAPIAQLGVLNGLNRELPYFLGKGERDQALQLASTAQCWALWVGGLTSIIFSVVALVYLCLGYQDLSFGWLSNAFGVFFLIFGTYYLQITFRTSGDFAVLSMINVAQSLFGLLLVGLVWLAGYYGLCLRAILSGALITLLLQRHTPLRVRAAWNTKQWIHLLKTGAPIYIVGQIYALWGLLDNSLVLKLEGVRALGIYQLVTITYTAFETLPAAFNQIVYPRMADTFGRTHDPKLVLLEARKPTIWCLSILIPGAFVAWLSMPRLVDLVLPKYHDGISAARWALTASVLASLGPFISVFNVLKRQDLFLFSTLSGIATYLICLIFLQHSQHEIANFPKAMAMGRCAYYIVAFIFALRVTRSREITSK